MVSFGGSRGGGCASGVCQYYRGCLNVGDLNYETVSRRMAMYAHYLDARGGGARPVFGIIDDVVDELEGKSKTQECCLGVENINDGGAGEGRRWGLERVHRLKAG